jgi:hypothetical protein
MVPGNANNIMRDYHRGHLQLKLEQHWENFGMIHSDSVEDEEVQEISYDDAPVKFPSQPKPDETFQAYIPALTASQSKLISAIKQKGRFTFTLAKKPPSCPYINFTDVKSYLEAIQDFLLLQRNHVQE